MLHGGDATVAGCWLVSLVLRSTALYGAITMPVWNAETPAAATGRTLVIGGAGAIGRRLIAAIIARSGPNSVVAGLRTTPLAPELAPDVICEFGVDVRNEDTIRSLLQKHADTIEVVWNLGESQSALSVLLARSPALLLPAPHFRLLQRRR